MKAIQSDVKTLLEGGKQFVLPLYQRRYSWRRKHWETLLRDLERVIREPERHSHFIGSFVTAPLDPGPEQSVNRYRLIDGQQRMTTILILLAALRDVATAAGEAGLGDAVEGLCLRNQYVKGEAERKLIPTGDDREALARLWLRPARPDEGRIGDAYRYFAGRLAGRDAAALTAMRHAVLGRLTAVSITLEGGDDPHLIFESLNAKGERLTQADLLRNYFLMKLPQADADDHFGRLWKPMQDTLDASLTNFFRHFLMRGGNRRNVRADEVYDHVKARVDERAATPAQVVVELELVAEHARNYARLLDPATAEKDQPTAMRLGRLHRLKSTTAYPFLLNVMRAQDEGRLPPDILPALLDEIESFLVRRLVCGVPTNQLRTIFGGLCAVAASAEDGPAFLREVRESLAHRQRCPVDAQFRDDLTRRPLYAGSKREVARYLLERIERSFEHKEPPDVTSANVQLEHVMPQTLTEAWLGELADGDPQAAAEEHGRWLHTLGNLTLTGYNPELGNQPYATKQKRLAQSSFVLNRHFAAALRWDAKAIAERGGQLADLAVKIWSDPGRGGLRTDAAVPSAATRKRPREQLAAVRFAGVTTPASTVSQAVQHVLRTLAAEDEPAFREAAIAVMGKRRVGGEPAAMRAPKQVGGLWIDLHGSAPTLRDWATRIAEDLRGAEVELEFQRAG